MEEWQEMVEAKLVVMRHACAACSIINSLNIETLEKAAARRSDFRWRLVEIGNPREMPSIEGLEVEKFPAIILNGEQITAGTVLPARRLMEILDLINPC